MANLCNVPPAMIRFRAHWKLVAISKREGSDDADVDLRASKGVTVNAGGFSRYGLVATFTVDSTADAVDANPGDGVCDDGLGNGTLRAAIMEANALAGADTIDIPAGIYTLTLGALTIEGDPSSRARWQTAVSSKLLASPAQHSSPSF